MANNESDQTVLDLTTLLEAFGEFNEDLAATLRLFIKTIAPQLNAISQKIDEGNLPQAAETAHAAKGIANTTGALRLGALCSEIDMALRHGDAVLARNKLAGMPAAFSEVTQEINRLLGS